ncbi:MAG: EAL domain-containing protein [Betaproteobacteria bacterium]|nr:MAG: EAL domain-containing protein [Betaproteobacteria bacterium]
MLVSRISQLTKIPFGTNEPLLQRALAAGGIGLWDYLPDSGFIDLYHNVISFKRLGPGRYYGPVTDFLDFLLPEDRSSMERLLEQCASGAESVELEFRVSSSSNRTVWLSCRGNRASLEDGRIRYVGTLADVTHRTERELRSLQFHESLFALARDPSVVASASLAETIGSILTEVGDKLEVTRASLWQFVDRDAHVLRCKYLHDTRNASVSADNIEITQARYPLYLAAIRQRRTLAVEDALTDPLLAEFRDEYLPQTDVRALLDVPVFVRGELWGVVCFEDCTSTRAWNRDEQTYASSGIDLLMVGVESAQRLKTERELLQTRERHRAFVQAAPDPIWCIDIDPPINVTETPQAQIERLRTQARVTDANAAFMRDYVLTDDRIIGRAIGETMPELFKGSSLRDWVDRGYRLVERELIQRGRGEAPANWLSLSLLGVVEDGKLIRMWGARRNITDRKRYQSLLEHLAYRDPLTGLLNRQRMVAEITDVCTTRARDAMPEPAAFLLIDLNLFKDINDTLGHASGDEVLRQMRHRLESVIKDTNAVAARLGGDEFAIFARDVGTGEGALRLGEAVGEAMREPFLIANSKFHLSASIGAALFPIHGTTFSELSRAADEAMYHAKNTGGGTRLFSRATVVFEQKKLGLLARLPAAIESGELTLEFQPLIHVGSRKPARMEALVRWNHPEYGRLAARDFVHKAEMSDSIRQLTRWVIDNAARAAKAWQSIAPGVGVSINISPRLLGDSAIVAHLQLAIAQSGLPTKLMDLEITETSLIHNQDRAAQVLEDCRALGFSIVIDDYGVGFCSLSYLRRLPLRGLKIDHSFVQRMSESAEDGIIVQSTITLAHNLGLTVVAEGVEDSASLVQLQTYGCDFAQGFGIAVPMSEADTQEWLRARVGNGNGSTARAVTVA